MKYFVKQIGEKDCGYTCVKMLLAIKHKNKNYLYYPTPQIETSSSLKELMFFAKKEGLILSASRIINQNEFYSFKSKDPFLVPIKSGDNLHLVLIKRCFKNKVLIYDPATSIYFLKKAEFLKKRNGEMLEVKTVEEKDYKKPIINIIPRPFMFLTLLCQILSFSCLISATLFIDKNFNFLIPIFLFLGYIIFEFLYQKSIISSLRYFDSMILVNDYSYKRSNFRKYIEPMNKFKYSLISTPLQIVNSFLILFFALFILGINNILSIFVVFILFFIQICFKLYEKLYFDKKIDNLESIERNLNNLNENDAEGFKKTLSSLNDETYKCVGYYNFKKYFMIFLTIASCLIYQAFTGEISINYMLFHFFIYIYLEENFDKVLNIPKLMNSIKYYKCLYLYYFH